MLFPLLLSAAMSAPSDTLPVASVVLLGDLIDVPTYASEEPPSPPPPAPEIPTLLEFASMSPPAAEILGLPHLAKAPTEVGFTRSELDRALRTVEDEHRRGGFPGAAIAIGRWDQTVVEQGFGTLDRTLGSPPVDPDFTIYDLASLTKVVATTTAVMLLVEDGRLDLNAPVSRYLPAFSGGNKDRVTIRHLLTHSSGLPAGGSVSGSTRSEAIARALAIPLKNRPGQKVEYSDIGFIVLWAAAEAAHEGPLEEMLRLRVFEPLDMWFTRFRPGDYCLRCAPTEDRPGYQGVVHDPIARRLEGVAGHAGLFSTAHDLARFAAMLAAGGELDGVRILKHSTIQQFTRRQPGVGTRALGWDTSDTRGGGAAGLNISSSAFGHTGFTGTSLWIDPARGTWVILLSNRTFRPSGPNRMQALRRELNDRIATSVDIGRDQ